MNVTLKFQPGPLSSSFWNVWKKEKNKEPKLEIKKQKQMKLAGMINQLNWKNVNAMCIGIYLTGLWVPLVVPFSLSSFLWKKIQERQRERKGHRPPPPSETSFPVPFLNKSQSARSPAQPVTLLLLNYNTVLLFSSLSIFIHSLNFSSSSLFSISLLRFLKLFRKTPSVRSNWIGLDCASSFMATPSAGSNDPTAATRRQTKRPKCKGFFFPLRWFSCF